MGADRDAEDLVERAWRRVLVERVAAHLDELDLLTDVLRPVPVGTVEEDPVERRRLEVEEELLADLDELRRRVARED